MAHRNQFEEFDGAGPEGAGPAQRPAACVVCEMMLPEAVDGTLDAAGKRVFEAHVAGCTACSQELAEAQRGAAWLGMLKSRAPEPPADLLAKILAGTSGAATPHMRQEATQEWATQPVAVRQRIGLGARLRAFGRSVRETFSTGGAQTAFQPRLAMTAAMAFFSIALTLNLMGVRLRDLRPEDFSASGIKRTMADTSAALTRTFQNNRSVYQVESRLSELSQDDARPRQGGTDR